MIIIKAGLQQSGNSCIIPNILENKPNQSAELTKGVFLAITVTFSLVFNTLCLVVLHRVRHRSLNHVTKIFMISFTMCDLFGIIIVYIPMTIATFNHDWPFGEVFCVINGFCSTIFAYTSGIQLVALNLERYLAITYPLKWYNIYVTPKRAKLVVAALWVSAIAFSALAYFIIPNRYTYYNQHFALCSSNPCGDSADISGTILIFIFAFSPVVMTFILWLKTYLIARRHRRSIIKQVHSVNSTPPATPPPTPSLNTGRSGSSLRQKDNFSFRSGVDNPTFTRKSDDNNSSFTRKGGDNPSFTRKGIDNPSTRKCGDNISFTRKAGTLDLLSRAIQINQVEQAVIKSNRQAFFTFCLMSICLALISLPFITVLVYDNIKRKVHVLPDGFIAVSQLLIVSFGFLNVLIYYARNKAFRKTAKRLFFKRTSDPYRTPPKSAKVTAKIGDNNCSSTAKRVSAKNCDDHCSSTAGDTYSIQ